jgi:deazaflavin-dependent oxidoreductase (nitroreductase family)
MHHGDMRRILLSVFAVLVGLVTVFWLIPNRVYYRAGRPTKIGRAVNAASAKLYALGLLPSFLESLETTGYRTGKPREIPVVIADYEGERYIVSMLGERSPWVRNIREADGAAVLRRGTPRAIHLVEVPPGERAPIIKSYVGRAIGARPHIPVDPAAPVTEFEKIAAAYPVFRIEDEQVARDREPALSVQR